MNRIALALSVGLISAILAACSGADEKEFETGPSMLPGDNCRSCHGAPASPYPGAPDWSIAGTVFETADSDRGVEGILVHVVDALGQSEILTTNRVGNFYTSTRLEAPYWVSLEQNGIRSTMPVPAPSGGCNACHRIPEVGNAPGKLYLSPDGTFPSIAKCDGEQTVTIGTSNYNCAPYRCRDTEGTLGPRCLGSCAGPEDCAPGAICAEERCIPE
jgi:hypothetical protein